MSNSDRFPDARGSSAVPRWSHRDPVEAGNPFPENDARHDTWQVATANARHTLGSIDRILDDTFRSEPRPSSYPDRVVDLAVSRFDVWAERGLSVVQSQVAVEHYRQWLETYLDHWLVYVADTCPAVEVGPDLRSRLTARVQHWLGEARKAPTTAR